MVIGRVRPGAGLQRAQAEMDAFAARRARDHPDTHKDTAVKLVPLRAQLAAHSSRSLLILFGAVALVLLIACVNVANLLIARGVSRQLGIRMALGAQRVDILRLVLRQGMTPVALGALGGLAGSIAASRLVASQLYGVSSTDPLTLITIVGLLGGAALFACWLPARRATKVAPVEALRCD